MSDEKYSFEDKILERGLNYYKQNKVTDITIRGELITAVVHGTYDYDVSMIIDENTMDILDLNCTCPYFYNGHNCKHLAALYYALGDSEDNIETIEPTVSDDELNQIKILMKTVPEDQLKEFLIEKIADYPDLARNFKSEFKSTITNDDLIYYNKKINQIFTPSNITYLNNNQFLSYNLPKIKYDASEFIKNDLEILFDKQLGKTINDLTKELYTNILNVSKYCKEDNFALHYIAINCVFTTKYVLLSDPKLEKEIFQWMLFLIDENYDSYLIEELSSLANDLCKTVKLEYLDEYIEKLIKINKDHNNLQEMINWIILLLNSKFKSNTDTISIESFENKYKIYEKVSELFCNKTIEDDDIKSFVDLIKTIKKINKHHTIHYEILLYDTLEKKFTDKYELKNYLEKIARDYYLEQYNYLYSKIQSLNISEEKLNSLDKNIEKAPENNEYNDTTNQSYCEK